MLRSIRVIGFRRFIYESPVDPYPMINLSELKALSSNINLDLPNKWLKTRLSSTRKQMRRWLKLPTNEQDNSVEKGYKDQLYAYLQRHHLGANLANLDEVVIEPRVIVPKEVRDPDNDKPINAGHLFDTWPNLAGELALTPPPNCTARQLLQRGERVVISGKCGTGKTSFLVCLALLCLDRLPSGNYSFLKGTLPVFIHLAEFDRFNHTEIGVDEVQTSGLMTVLSAAISDRFDNLREGELDFLLRSKIDQGKLLLLIDGWDELPSINYAPYVKWLELFLGMYPDCQVIISGPTQGLGPLTALGFMISGLLPWRKGEVEANAQAWSEQLNTEQSIAPSDYWHPGQTNLETYLRWSLLLGEEVISLSDPHKRNVDLMDAVLKKILSRIGSKSADEWQTVAIRNFWQYLAYTLVKSGQLIASKTDVIAIARTVLKSFLADIDELAINSLTDALEESCLFVKYPNGNVGFLSPVIRDYLAAVYMARTRERDIAGSYFDEPHWSGVLRFVVGRIGAISLLKQLHNNGRKLAEDDLFILAEWLPEARDHQQWRRQVLIGLGQVILNQDKSVILRQRAIASLAKTGEEGVTDLLKQLLNSPAPAIRQTALAAFAKISPTEAIPLNERMMSDAEEVIRVATVHSLAWIDDEATNKPLVKALLEPDEPVREAAAVGLALNGSRVSREILADAITDKAMSVRLAAVHGLSLIEDAWSTKLLETVLNFDENRLVKGAAENALLGRKQDNILEKWRPVRAGEQQWLIEWAFRRKEIVPVGPAAVPLILEALSDEDATVRAAAVRTLATLSVKEAIGPVANLLADPDPEVKAAALNASLHLNRAWGAAV